MPKTRSFSLLPILFFTLILSVLMVWGILGNNPQDISIMEGRVLAKFTTTGFDLRRAAGRLFRGNASSAVDALQNLIQSRSDQKLIETAASDQFPLRLIFIS
ncbi:MAG: hypothetical protein MUO40_02165, partial [Anaerolineaceae bacterium]|nr:hypothetical protein [Anaerolineaceae bacterium]